MKNLLLLLLLFNHTTSFGQYYSGYYGTYKVNSNIKVTGHIKKTITTIDYGALANANAIKERNRLMALKYADEKEREICKAIAKDPSNAFNYGTDNHWKLNYSERKNMGFKNGLKYMYHKKPHSSLFVKISGYNYENISPEGIKTSITINTPHDLLDLGEEYSQYFDVEELMKLKKFIVGETRDWRNKKDLFIHKKEINRSRIAGLDGFCGTLIMEDNYEKSITDYYTANLHYKKGIYQFTIEVTYKGEKDNVSFEQLEGRKYYFSPLINKIVSTIKIY